MGEGRGERESGGKNESKNESKSKNESEGKRVVKEEVMERHWSWKERKRDSSGIDRGVCKWSNKINYDLLNQS